MRKAIFVAVLGAMFATTSAYTASAADDAKPAEPTPAKKAGGHHAKYGAAGCGLGSIIIGNSPGIVQIFAATTNATFYSQTYGITSGTSNCDSGDSGDDSARIFIYGNREALAKDISRGNGETISNLSTLAGCQDPKAVGVSLQHSFKAIFPNASVSTDQVSDAILNTLKSDKTLACGSLG
jgi:hypothetical protein